MNFSIFNEFVTLEKVIRERFRLTGDYFNPKWKFFVPNNINTSCFSPFYICYFANQNYNVANGKEPVDLNYYTYVIHGLDVKTVDPIFTDYDFFENYLTPIPQLTFEGNSALALYGYFTQLCKSYEWESLLDEIKLDELFPAYCKNRFYSGSNHYRVINGWLYSIDWEGRYKGIYSQLTKWRIPPRKYFIRKYWEKHFKGFCELSTFTWVLDNCYAFDVTVRFAVVYGIGQLFPTIDKRTLWLAYWCLKRGNNRNVFFDISYRIRDCKGISIKEKVGVYQFTSSYRTGDDGKCPDKITVPPKVFYKDKLEDWKAQQVKHHNKKYDVMAYIQIPPFKGDDKIIRLRGFTDYKRVIKPWFPWAWEYRNHNHENLLDHAEVSFIYLRDGKGGTDRYFVEMRHLPHLKNYRKVSDIDWEECEGVYEPVNYWTDGECHPVLKHLVEGNDDGFKTPAFCWSIEDMHGDEPPIKIIQEIVEFVEKHDQVFGNLKLMTF